jgi:FAD synthetase
MTKVLIFGTFDNFHAGHEYFINEAKKLGDSLIITVARDETVKKIKGHLPEQPEKIRLKTLKKLNIADKVVLGSLTDKYKIIKKYRPDIIALGYDQFVFTYTLEKKLIDLKLDAKIIRLKPYKPNIYKSSLLKEARSESEVSIS